MNQRVQDLLKKITYIEADIEIQKQILFSIPLDKQKEMEQVITVIATKKNEIKALRLELQSISPEEHQNIMTLENAVAAFKKIASEKKFTSIDIMKINEEFCLHLKNQPKIHCLVKACDEEGGWTIISIDGVIQHFSKVDVDEIHEVPLSR
jgi:hypothetical protein